MQIQEIITRFNNPVNDFDEYDIFRNVINNLKMNNSDFFNVWFNYLNETDKKTFHTLCSTSIVKLTNENKINSVPRKISNYMYQFK